MQCHMETYVRFANSIEPMRSLGHFESGGRQVRVETFIDPAFTDAPSIVVLHGATGVLC